MTEIWTISIELACHSLSFHMLLPAETSVGEVQFGPVPGHFCQTGDQMVWSLMKFLGLGLGPPGTVYIGLVLVQTQSRLRPAKICTMLSCRIHRRMERAGVQSRSVWVGVKGGWHTHTMLGGACSGWVVGHEEGWPVKWASHKTL